MADSVPYVDITAQWLEEREHLLPILDKVLSGGQYVGGKEVQEFEDAAKSFFGAAHVVALNSGTDALVCALAAVGVGVGDEVITPPNSFVASTAAITHLRARPVYVDVKADQNIDETLIESAIGPKTKAIMPVHLTGRMAAMQEINRVADRHGVAVIEDSAQSAGSKLFGRDAGTWGTVGCFSAHPLKNLNACGDAGFILTDNESIAGKIRSMRNHGLVDRNTVERFGFVSRMDSIQAAVLHHRLSKLPGVIQKRRENVALYRRYLNPEWVFHPQDGQGEDNSWHTFVIQVEQRDELKAHLTSKGIETAIHYPIPIHLQPAAKFLGYVKGDFPETESQAGKILTLPIHQYLDRKMIENISAEVNQFYDC